MVDVAVGSGAIGSLVTTPWVVAIGVQDGAAAVGQVLDVAEAVGQVVLAGGSGCAALTNEVVAVDVEDTGAGGHVLRDQDLVVAGVDVLVVGDTVLFETVAGGVQFSVGQR